MSVVLRRIIAYTKEHPVLRGMATYAILWPSSNLCQQVIQGRPEINISEVARFSLFGSCYVAPTLFLWVKAASYLFPGKTVKVAITKALVEQIIYSPIAIGGFFVGMNLLERKTLEEATEELKQKFIPTFKTGFMIWPAVQTINFAFIKERNRVSVTGVVSFFWTIFLSYMKQKDNPKILSIK